MEVILKVNKRCVYDEVAKTTEYTGDKMTGDETAYERIMLTDEDTEMINRFWNECKTIICNNLKKVLISETEAEGEYLLVLGLSASFDKSLTESMERSLFSFFVMNIAAKWYTFANKGEATGYATEAATYIDDIKRKAFHKKRPTRPTYNQ